MNFGSVLRATRAAYGLSQRELAELAGMPRSTVDRLESGRMTPRIDTAQRLLGAVGHRLVVRTMSDRPLEIDEEREALRDRHGRHYPAHLPLDKPEYMGEGPNWWGWHRIAWWPGKQGVPEHMYWHPAHGSWLHRRHSWEDAT